MYCIVELNLNEYQTQVENDFRQKLIIVSHFFDF